MSEAKDYIKKRLEQKAKPEVIKEELLVRGFLESDVDKVVKETTGKDVKSSVVNRFVFREIFSKFSTGFGNDQFIYIFLYLLTGSYFILGITVGFSVVLSLLFSIFLYDYFEIKQVSKLMVSLTGLIMCLCFLLVALGIYFDMPYLLIIAVILLALGNVLHGDIYTKAYEFEVENNNQNSFLTRLGGYSLLFVVIGLLVGGFFLENYKLGYYYNFVIAAICLLLSGLILQSLIVKTKDLKNASVMKLFKQRFSLIRQRSGLILRNKVVVTLAVASTLTALVQTIGNAYYGVFIYEQFTNSYFFGFLNVGVIFTVAILTSLFSIYIAKSLSKRYGNVPLLVFGTLLISILPLTMWHKPNLVNISMAMVCAVIGGAIVGLATGLLLSNYLSEQYRHWYFQTYSLLISLSYVIIIPFAAYIAQQSKYVFFGEYISGLQMMFALLGFMLLIVVVPLYFSIFFIEKKKVV